VFIGLTENSSESSFDIAVSIVAYRSSHQEIAGLVQSLSRSRKNVHITVVDNSETIALGDTIEALGAEYVHPLKNLGFGGGHNLAIQKTLTKAKYHAVINPDISFDSDILQELFDFMELHPDVGQVMPAILNEDGTEQRLTKRLPTPFDLFLRRFLGGFGKKIAAGRWARYETRDLDLSIPCEVPCLSGCFMFLRSTVLQHVGLFDERYFLYMEDFDLCRRIGSVSKTVINPLVTATHGYHKGSYKQLRLLAHHLWSAISYFQKWGWFHDVDRKTRNQQCGAPTSSVASYSNIRPLSDFPVRHSETTNATD
jgi:GT2 family glycosyltransferase